MTDTALNGAENAVKPPFLKKWFIAMRPWAFPASIVPVCFGTALAVFAGNVAFRPLGFIMALVGMMILQGASNILNDAIDYRKGLDRVPTPVSGAVVRGYITPEQAVRGAAVLYGIGALLGLGCVWFAGPVLLAIGGVGLVVGIIYSVGGPVSLKFHALGDFAVFFNFGILGTLGAWTVQTAEFSWLPVAWAVPIGLHVIGILHANNWRDIPSDSDKSVMTVASILGDRGSLVYYAFLIYSPFAIVLGLLAYSRMFDAPVERMPLTMALVLLALPLAVRLFRKAVARRAPEKPMDFITLDGATAQLNLVFGLLCIVGIMAQVPLACL